MEELVMHPYATNSTDRRRVPLYVAGVAFLVAWFVSRLIAGVRPRLPFWVEIPSVFGLYALGYEWFRRRLWHSRWWRFLARVETPNLAGTWSGAVTSSFDQHAAEHPVTVELTQNWTDISVRLASQHSTSESVAATLTTDEAGTSFSYEYLNEPRPGAVETMQAHRGTARLRLSADGTRLEGEYYSGRGREHQGNLTLRRVPKSADR